MHSLVWVDDMHVLVNGGRIGVRFTWFGVQLTMREGCKQGEARRHSQELGVEYIETFETPGKWGRVGKSVWR